MANLTNQNQPTQATETERNISTAENLGGTSFPGREHIQQKLAQSNINLSDAYAPDVLLNLMAGDFQRTTETGRSLLKLDQATSDKEIKKAIEDFEQA